MKKKIMTTAEALEYFKRKKILAEGEDANIGVQKKLFQCGIEWVNGGRVPSYHSDYLIVGDNGLLYHCGCDDRYWFAHFYESVDDDDILSIEIVEDCAKDDEDPYFGGRIKDLQEMLEDDEVLIITKTNFLTMMK